jgi:replication factor A1
MSNQTQINYIKNLHDGNKKVYVEGKIVEKGNERLVKSKFGDAEYKLVDAVLADSTGAIKLSLWNEQCNQIQVGDNVTVENGYVTSFKGEIQLNVGKFGKLTVN